MLDKQICIIKIIDWYIIHGLLKGQTFPDTNMHPCICTYRERRQRNDRRWKVSKGLSMYMRSILKHGFYIRCWAVFKSVPCTVESTCVLSSTASLCHS